MKNSQFIAYMRIAFALLAFGALGTQMVTSLQRHYDLVNFFSFFTIQSNVLAAIVLLIVGIGTLARQKSTPQFALLRGGATLYMTITGIVFALLLSGLEERLQVTVPWVNITLHYVMPAVIFADWLLFPPAFRFTLRRTLIWLAFPITYLGYSLIRGAIIHWYPYPFLNVAEVGPGAVALTCVLITLGAIGLSWILTLRTRQASTKSS